MDDLLKKLKSSGLIKNGNEISRSEVKACRRLEDVLSGKWIYHNAGNVFHIHELLPYGYEYGNATFTRNIIPLTLYAFEEIPKIFAANIKNIVFLDIETSNLSLGAGSFVFLIGICYFSDIGVETDLLLIDHPGSEQALLETFQAEISRFEIISSYNGKSFDIPFLRNRYAIHQLDGALNFKFHIDLLTYARRLWKFSIESCKLANIENNILGLKRDDDEIPGWLVPQIYFDFLYQRDPNLLKGVICHNKMDVISLAALFQHITFLLNETGSNMIYDNKDYFALAKLYSKMNAIEKAKYYYGLGFKNISDNHFTPCYYWEYGMLLKKNNEHEEALLYWEKSGNAGIQASCIELSKYYEHKMRNYAIALKWAKKAQEMIRKNKLLNKRNAEDIPQIQHRMSRIIRKMKKHEK